MRGHCRNQAGIVGNDQTAPFSVDTVGIGQTKNGVFNTTHHRIGLACGEAEAVTVHRTGAHGPEFHEILRGDADSVSCSGEVRYRLARLPVLRVSTMKAAEDDVRIGKNVHYVNVAAECGTA